MTTAASVGLDIDQIGADLAEARGLPLRTYYDPEIHAFELETIFDRTWQALCPVHEVMTPGSIYAGTVGRTPVLVTRGQDGRLSGFLNVCRHRGFQIMDEGRSSGRLLRCRYHAWAYDLNGALVVAPDTDNEPGFSKCDHGLVEVLVEEWGPVVFVNPDPKARPLLEAHPQLEGWADRANISRDPARYEPYKEFTLHQRSNWKLWYDNGTECYHCPTVHSKSFGDAFDVRDGNYSYELDGGMTTYAFKSTAQEIDGVLRSLKYGSYQVFPGVQLIQQDDMMILGRMIPTGPESCEFKTFYLKEVGADPDRVDRWIDIWQQTYVEDGEVTEVQQRNIKSPNARPFRYIAAREEPTLFINRLIWEAYRTAA
jgi:phenylpropionate dioxygenase-like ring-hydroxylating dioxygenase large terminal subunit